VELCVEQDERLLEGFAVLTLDRCEEAASKLGVARIETEGIRRLGQLLEQEHETDETLAFFGGMRVRPGRVPEALGDAVPVYG
jgi:hypothetical protein